MDRFSKLIEKKGLAVLDGAMATQLEARGCDINDELWSAKMLAEAPELIEAVHLDYFEAGADIGTSASYQATVPGFMKKGFSREASEALIKRSMELLISARDKYQKEHPEKELLTAAAAVGPYGAYLADGSEYRGDYIVDSGALESFHRERMELLKDAGADIFACETLPCLWEAEIILDVAKELDAPCWFSFSCRDGAHISDGTPISECAKRLDGEDIVKAVGVNCTRPEYISKLIENIRSSCSKPVVVYPNRGEEYDPVRKIWLGAKNAKDFGAWTEEWYGRGASVIGGCCRTTPGDIAKAAAFRNGII